MSIPGWSVSVQMSFLGTYSVSASLVGRFAGEGTKEGSPPLSSQCSSRVEFDSVAVDWLYKEETWEKSLVSVEVVSAAADDSAELDKGGDGVDSVRYAVG